MKHLAYIAAIAMGLLCATVCEAVKWPIIEQDSSHALNKTYGDWNSKYVLGAGFHTGVDIPSDTGLAVFSVVNGYIICIQKDSINNYKNGCVIIGSTMADSVGWHCGHIRPKQGINLGDIVSIGDTIGFVASFPGDNHIHFMKSNDTTGFIGYQNPLDSLIPEPFQSPRICPKANVSHPYEIYYYKDQNDSISNNYGATTSYLRGAVDITVRAATTINGDTICGVYSLGYGITPKNSGGNIPFRKMFEMTGQIALDTARYFLTYNKLLSTDTAQYYIVTNCGNTAPIGLSNIKDSCWNTKAHKTTSGADADSIEDALFPDGYYVTTVKAWAHNGDSVVAIDDSILVDNFAPRVKKTYPAKWDSVMATRKLWCTFSEKMDSHTVVYQQPVRVISYRNDTLDVSSVQYVCDTMKITLAKRLLPRDTVKVQLLSRIHDLAGKPIEGGVKADSVAYEWTFTTTGIIQITDNDINDRQCDVWHGKVVWRESAVGASLGKIKMYDYDSDTTILLSSNDNLYRLPKIYGSNVVWYQGTTSYTNPVWRYDGSTISIIADADRVRSAAVELSDNGVVWRSWCPASGDNDSVWVEYYDFNSTTKYVLDNFVQDGGRYSGTANIFDNKISWDGMDTTGQDNTNIRLYDINTAITSNVSYPCTLDDYTPDISYGQVAWRQCIAPDYPGRIMLYDGKSNVEIAGLPEHSTYWGPFIDNGLILYKEGAWNYETNYLHYNDGADVVIDTVPGGEYYDGIINIRVDKQQAAYLKLRDDNTGIYNACYFDYNRKKKIRFTTGAMEHTQFIALHDGFVVFEKHDGNDYEIFMYIADTLCNPPAIVRSLQQSQVVVKTGQARVQLTWIKNTESDLAGYRIYRSSSSHAYSRSTPYAQVAATDSSYIDDEPLSGDNYYVVTAYNQAGYMSGYSNQVVSTIPLSPPQNLTAACLTPPLRVALAWQKPAGGKIAKYYVYRRDDGGVFGAALDSIAGTDTTYTDISVSSEFTYFYCVDARDSAGHVSGNSNEAFAIAHSPLLSSTSKATAHNNSRKLSYSTPSGALHFAYQSAGHVWHAMSFDEGATWANDTVVGACDRSASLALDTAGYPSVLWPHGSGLEYAHQASPWIPPVPGLPACMISRPSLAISRSDTAIAAFTEYYYISDEEDDESAIGLARFPVANFDAAVVESLGISGKTPMIAIDDSGTIHLAFVSGDVVQYMSNPGGVWSAPEAVSEGTAMARHPVIDAYGDRLCLAWEQDQGGAADIYGRARTISTGMWSAIENISNNPSSSRNPAIAASSYLYWADDSTGKYQIYRKRYIDGAGWPDSAKALVAASDSAGDFPQLAYRQVLDATIIFALWTQGDTMPYRVAFNKAAVQPVPKIYIDGGTATASPFNIHRDGYRVFGPASYQSVDYGSEYVSYQFNGLNSWQDYRIAVTYYWQNEGGAKARAAEQAEESAESGNFWIEQLKIDQQTVANDRVRSGEKVVIERDVPRKLYDKDSSIVLTVNRIKGGYAMATDIKLYAFDKPGQGKTGGCVTSAAAQSLTPSMPLVNELLQNTPNPFGSGATSISYALATPGHVSLKIYNCAGQLVRTLVDAPHQPGRYRPQWDGKNDAGAQAAAGIYHYRIIAGRFSDTRKMVLVK